MLEAELSGQPYSKADHNRRLQARIRRNKGSIEFKHQNVSAVLVNFRQPFIAGYLPRQNYQKLLEQVVLEWLAIHPRFFQRLSTGPVLMPRDKPVIRDGVSKLVEAAPESRVEITPTDASERKARFFRTDFVRRDAENRKLGQLGEEWVIDFEKRRLTDNERRPDLAKR